MAVATKRGFGLRVCGNGRSDGEPVTATPSGGAPLFGLEL